MEDMREELMLEEDEIRQGAPFAALGYVFFLWILAFIFKKDDNRFARFHLRQGIVIFVGELICLFLLIIPGIGSFFCRLGLIILFLMSFMGIFSSLTGKTKPIYLISDIAKKLVV